MNLSDEYKRQFQWRDWQGVFRVLPDIQGQTVLDLGCGVGDLSAELIARGARVIGIDLNEELLQTARERRLPNAEFRSADLRSPLELDTDVDGIWSSFAAAYFPNLPDVLKVWTKPLRPGGWIALTEIDDLFGHEPLSAESKSLFESYARDGISAGRYDFHMGRKLQGFLEQSGFAVRSVQTAADQEFSFQGPARADVLGAWRIRLDRMRLLRDFCGSSFDQLRDEFLSCLTRTDHRSIAKVNFCLAMK